MPNGSASTRADFPSGAWGFNFNFGNAINNLKTSDFHVRAVRAGSCH